MNINPENLPENAPQYVKAAVKAYKKARRLPFQNNENYQQSLEAAIEAIEKYCKELSE